MSQKNNQISIEKMLLEKALDSILNGHTMEVSEQDSSGRISVREIKINDLRVFLAQELAKQIILSRVLADFMKEAITPDFIKQFQDKVLGMVGFSDLPYSVRDHIEKKLEKDATKIHKVKLDIEYISE